MKGTYNRVYYMSYSALDKKFGETFIIKLSVDVFHVSLGFEERKYQGKCMGN